MTDGGRERGRMVLTVVEQPRLAAVGDVLQVRVELDLVDGRLHHRRLQHRVEVLLDVVGHADRPGPARGPYRLHLGPLGLEDLGVAACEEGRVDKVQVDIVEPQLLQRCGEVLLDGLVRLDRRLGRDKELLAGDAGRLDRGAEFLLVVVSWVVLLAPPCVR